MAKKPRENRVPIMMSDEELRLIDDWRFNNRIATRSDALRRLAKIGITTEEWIADAERLAEEAMNKYFELLRQIVATDPPDDVLNACRSAYLAVSLAWVEVIKVTRAANFLTTESDISDAIAFAEGVVQQAHEEKALLYEQWFEHYKDKEK